MVPSNPEVVVAEMFDEDETNNKGITVFCRV